MYILKAKFEWDPAKARSNRHKHGISFEEAITAFDDPDFFVAPDSRHSETESRQWLIGKIDSGVPVIVVFTERGNRIRIISARRASRRERRIYETVKGIPF